MRFVLVNKEWCVTLYKEDSELDGVVIPYLYNNILFFVVFKKEVENIDDELVNKELQAKEAVQEAAKNILQAPPHDEEEKERIIEEAIKAKQILDSFYFGSQLWRIWSRES